MTFVKINNQVYLAIINGKTVDKEWDGRESKAITLEMSYEDALVIFVDETPWYIIHQPDSYLDEEGNTVTPDPIEYDNSEFSVAGSITDHRNGTVTVKMGKSTEVEVLQKQLANAVTEEELATAYMEGVNSL